jgi:hypothetical protein
MKFNAELSLKWKLKFLFVPECHKNYYLIGCVTANIQLFILDYK